MQKIYVDLEASPLGEWIVDGLGDGYCLIDQDSVEAALSCSKKGFLFPYRLTRRLPKLDQPGLLAYRCQEIPLLTD